MSQYTESNVKSYQASAALGQYLRVKKTAGKLALASSTEVEIGTTERAAYAVDDDTPVRLRTAPGTCVMVANAAIPNGAEVFAAAGGKVAPAGTVSIGHADSAAGADGDQIEVLRS